MAIYIKDLIDLPERVRRGDFVLKLAEGVSRPDETVRSYVVTPQLADSFDRALDLIKAGVDDNTSKGCYLHGSFGSGKSHFMAVLNLILEGNPSARSIPELSHIIAKHNSWTQGRRFLLVPYHMIGKENMEQAILGGYVDFVKKRHPDTLVPGIYRADELFQDAARYRETLGDEAFFEKLNAGSGSGDGGWGLLSTGWTAAAYDAAVNAPSRSDERSRLVGALVERFFSAVRGAGEYVELDVGLSIISRHAKSMGYDAVVLFLDELILWLASRSADVAFVNREGPKLAKLVESQTAIPLISFVARQRDLKELIGENVTGAQYLNFSDALDWWEARFATIKLEDKNLPAIAEKRVLKPKSAAAKEQIDAAFKKTDGIREDVMNILLTSQSDREMFRKIYPFSPAFMDTLVAMSFLLQRERTSLKVMLQLLIEQKETLELGEIIPVGDLFDPVAEGDEAVSDDVRKNFVHARKLYEEKLRPLLEREHKLSMDDLPKRPRDDRAAMNLKNDDRLIKTLLLAALAPNVEALRGITASQLAALNHGTIRSPIPGHETQIVLTKCRKWAAEVGQLKIGDEPSNPTISIQLSGVDTETIIDQAKRFDNDGNRVREMRKLIFQSFGIEDQDGLFLEHTFTWKGTPRICSIKFDNIRKLALDNFKNDQRNWLVFIDYPFDETGYGPKDDIAKLTLFQEEFPEGAKTLVIVPSFLNQKSLKALGRFVIINNLLKGDNFNAYSGHLSANDKQVAKTLLENQQSQLRQQILRYIDNSYGISRSDPDALDSESDLELAEHFQSLLPGLTFTPPTGANLKTAFIHLLGQALSFQFPAHPPFEDGVRLAPAVVKKVFDEIEKAVQSKDGRVAVEKTIRKDIRMIANPLKLGSMEETHFILGHFWKDHFLKIQAGNPEKLTVATLRAWMKQPKPMGLPKILENLIILSFSVQTNRLFFDETNTVEPGLDELKDHFELRAVNLPSETDWDSAVKRAGAIFGITQSSLLNAGNVAKFSEKVKADIVKYKTSCNDLYQKLDTFWNTRGGVNRSAPRLLTATAAKVFVEEMDELEGVALVTRLANWQSRVDPGPTDATLGSSITKADKVKDAIEKTKWSVIERAEKLDGKHENDAKTLRKGVNAALEADELVTALAPKIQSLEKTAWDLIQKALDEKTDSTPLEPESDPADRPSDTPVGKSQKRTVLKTGEKNLNRQEMEAAFKEICNILDQETNAQIELKWTIYKDTQ
jgi:hypothetical protein